MEGNRRFEGYGMKEGVGPTCVMRYAPLRCSNIATSGFVTPVAVHRDFLYVRGMYDPTVTENAL